MDDWVSRRIAEEGGPWDEDRWGSMPEPVPIRPIAPVQAQELASAPKAPKVAPVGIYAPMPNTPPPDPNKPHWYMGEWHAPGSRYGPVPTDDVGERLLVRFIAHLAGFGRKP